VLVFAREHRLALVLFFVAFALRLVYQVALSRSPLFQGHVADALYHEDWARRILEGDLFSLRMNGVLYKAPLYPYFLALGTWLSGSSNFLPMLLQVGMMAGSCVLLFLIARRTLGTAAAFIGALVFCWYFPSVYFSTEMEIPALAIFLTLLSYCLLVSGAGWRSLAGSAFVFGLSLLALPSNLLLLPLYVLKLTWRQPSFSSGLKRAGAYAALALLTVSPCTVRNWVAGRQLTLISANGGINFFIGNNADYDRTVYLQPGYAFEDFYDRPRREAGAQSIAERDRFWYAKAFEFIGAHPGQELRLLGKKLALYLANYEISRNTDSTYAKQTSIYRHLPFLPAWLILAAGVGGLIIALRKDPWLAGVGALLALPCLIFFVTDRYRLPSMAIWAVFAGVFVTSLGAWWKARAWRAALLPVTGMIVVTVVSCLNLFVVRNQTYRPHLILGFVHESQSHYPQALQEYSTALGLVQAAKPVDTQTEAEILCRRGNLSMSMGDLQAAREDFERALAVEPRSGPAASYLGSLYAQQKQPEQAGEMFTRALEINPWDVVSLHNFGLLLLNQSRIDEALAKLNRASELAPEHAGVHSDLAYAYGVQGRYDLMESEAKQAIHYNPREASARYNLASLYLNTGRPALALAEYQAIAKTAPQQASNAFNQMGVMAAQANDLPQAIGHWRKALEVEPNNEGARSNLKRAEALSAGFGR
jgi:tetratricopeptide (TPR) repeat protein